MKPTAQVGRNSGNNDPLEVLARMGHALLNALAGISFSLIAGMLGAATAGIRAPSGSGNNKIELVHPEGVEPPRLLGIRT